MILEIPIKSSSFYNFEFFTSINRVDFWMSFLWQKRQNSFLFNMGYSPTYPLLVGFPVVCNIQVNSGILQHLEGSLFFYPEDDRISSPKPEDLGTRVKLIYYLPNEEEAAGVAARGGALV